MNYEEYLIKKDKKDLLSSLKLINEEIISKKLKEYDLKSIEELKKYIIDSFKFCLHGSKNDIFTIRYFQRLIDHEDSEWLSAYQSDIEDFFVFIYENKGYYSYYIPTEIKKIIKKELNI